MPRFGLLFAPEILNKRTESENLRQPSAKSKRHRPYGVVPSSFW
jgi:hypothetical protein